MSSYEHERGNDKDRLAHRLEQEYLLQQAFRKLVKERTDGAVNDGPQKKLPLSLNDKAREELSSDRIIKGVEAAMNEACQLRLSKSRLDPRKLVLHINTKGWRLIVVPEEPFWLVVFASRTESDLRGASITGLSWHLDAPKVGTVSQGLPLWLLEQARVDPEVAPRPPEIKPIKGVFGKSANGLKGVDLSTVLMGLRVDTAPLRDAFTLLHWAAKLHPRRSWEVELEAEAQEQERSDGRSIYVVSPSEKKTDFPWPDRGLRLQVRRTKKRAVICEVTRDPASAQRWLLLGPEGLEGDRVLEEVVDDSYRHQRNLLDRMSQGEKLDRLYLAAAATQTRTPSQKLPPEKITRLRGEHPWEHRQLMALKMALSGHLICAIKGPPGTGKSTVIVGLVRRLVRRNARVLLVAPTHVAIDEVLGRLHRLREQGYEDKVLPVRVAPRDEGRLDANLLQYVPRRLARSIARKAQRHLSGMLEETDAEAADDKERQKEEELSLAERELQLVRALVGAQGAHERAESIKQQVDQRLKSLKNLAGKTRSKLSTARKAMRAAKKAVKDTRPSGIWDSVTNFFTGDHKKAKQKLEACKEKVKLLEQTQVKAAAEIEEATAKLQDLTNRLEQTEERRDRASQAIERAGFALPGDAVERLCELADHVEALRDAQGKLAKQRALWRRWRDHLNLESNQSDLERWVLGCANVVAATTQGIGSSPEFRDTHFDLVICDESSRVTRGEILTPASRADRVVLVGDEHQLPPYVENRDEQLLQAFAVLDRTREHSAERLKEAADELAQEWNTGEPEFRRLWVDEVARRALELKSMGKLPKAKSIRRQDSPAKRRIAWRSISDTITASCFDHVLARLPEDLTVRLNIQRRMPAQNAALVSSPVYGGDYLTPEQDPVVPLTTDRLHHSWMLLDTSLACRTNKQFRDSLKGTGFVNPGEAMWVRRVLEEHARTTKRKGTLMPSMMVISYYLAQARLIESMLSGTLRGKVAVLPIDRCQGQEADVVVISFVRSKHSPRQGYGLWLQDPRRLNVALTRARKSLILVGNLNTLSGLHGNEYGERIYKHLLAQIEKEPDHVIRDFQ